MLIEELNSHFAKPVLYAVAVEKAQISIYNEDCLQALKAMADKQFDLAIVLHVLHFVVKPLAQ